ncbi:MAG: hypothetical protein KF774_00125 [Planctomyces sp.]|nr:hypothetical protein [Planctomyces sp.]
MDDWKPIAGNDKIDEDLQEILNAFPEPSRRRMDKKIRQNAETLAKHGTEAADAHARHTFREFLVAYELNKGGCDLVYGETIGGKTPDWLDVRRSLLLEAFTIERGGSGDVVKRATDSIAHKAHKYRAIIEDNNLHFVLGVHGDFLSFFISDDCEEALERCQDIDGGSVSGVVHFSETHATKFRRPDGTIRVKQIYRFEYLPNPRSKRPIDLAAMLP